MEVTLVHIVVAVIEFNLINWLGRHSIRSGYYWLTTLQDVEQSPLFNATFRVLAPTIYLVITAAFWYAVGLDGVVREYWHVTVFYFLIRTVYQLAYGRRRIVRWGNQAFVAALAISLSVLVYHQLLIDRSAVLPSGRGLTDQLWIVVIGFLYLALRGVSWPRLGKSNEEMRADYLHAAYNLLRKKYGAIVTDAAASRPVETIAYAVMLYESFNRPPIFQWVERHFLFPGGFASTLGPMQVTTDVSLPNETLVKLGVERVNADFEEAIEAVKRNRPEIFIGGKKSTPIEQDLGASGSGEVHLTRFEEIHRSYQSTIVREAAGRYNVRSDYPDQIASIYRFLRDNYYQDIRGPGDDDGLG